MIFSPKYSNAVAAFLDLVSFLLTYPWLTCASLAVSCYLNNNHERDRLGLKLLQWFLFGPLLALLVLILLPLFLSGQLLWIVLCSVCRSQPYTYLKMTEKCERPQKELADTYTFASANLLLCQEVFCKRQNASFVYSRLRHLANNLVKKQTLDGAKRLLDNIDTLNKLNKKTDSVMEEFPPLDFICLQEVFDRFFALALISMLRTKYCHFVFDVGVNSFSTNMFMMGEKNDTYSI